MSTDAYGVDDSYHDALGKTHATSKETRAAILEAMGLDPKAPAAEEGGVRVLRLGQPVGALRARGELLLEDGARLRLDGELPAGTELPLGYHRLRRDGEEREELVIVSPRRCYLPEGLRTWGWAAQLYAARSRQSWGIGDLADLRRLGRWSKQELGAGVVMVNPLSAVTPVPPIEASPYYPSSRRFRNPLFLRIEEVPGAEALGAQLQPLAEAGRALNRTRRIDREAIFKLKMEALGLIFDQFRQDPAFDRYWKEQGEALTQFAAYCVLAERHGRDWRSWPEEYRAPGSSGVGELVTEQARRVRFHAWIQWLLDQQLAQASAEIAVVQDLPIGLDVAGADAWCWQDLMARGISVGAPPDEFNEKGQDWGLTPFIPWKLRAAGYQPFIETIRSTLRHAGGLRIDHVMGLFRLFWIPRELGAAGGTYVRYAAEELLAIVALESERAKAFVVGEDLGTVEEGVRETLADNNMLSYRLLYFEPRPPAEFPELALSSVTTHDLPTVAGLWGGDDLEQARSIGLEPNEEGTKALREKLADLGDITDDEPVEAAVVKTHRALARAPSRVILATLDDALAVPERPNMPGTTTAWPNWSLALPVPLEEVEKAALPRTLADVMSRK
jgi:4-alpha-glucanotransferase